MTIFKRAIRVMIRQLGKSILLFSIIFIFATILLGAISMRNAMIATGERLLLQVPAVATTIYEPGDMPSTIPWRQPTSEEIHAIGSLPYVRAYDFTVRPFFYSEDLVWAEIDNPGTWGDRGRAFEGRGVNHPEIADVETGVVNLIEGRTFTQAEIEQHSQVVVIPRDIAKVNDLRVGSVIELENVVYNFFSEGEEDAILATQRLEVEVIGIIGRDVEDVTGDPDFFYMPFGVAESMLNFRTEAQLEFDEERFREVGQGILEEKPLIEMLFVLNSPRDLEDFSASAMEFLPENWIVVGIDESVFAPVIASMDMVLQIADSVQWFAVAAVVIALTLLMLLFLHDRRHEIGIYCALGEKKYKIVIQIVTEVMFIAIVAIAFSTLVGNLLSETISVRLFEQQLAEQMNNEGFFVGVPGNLGLHHPGMMSIDEALELYDVTLDTQTVRTFIRIGIGVVFLSTLLPIWYIVKLEPKKLLL